MEIADYTRLAKKIIIMPVTTEKEIQAKYEALDRLIGAIKDDDKASCINDVANLLCTEPALQQWCFNDWNRDYYDDDVEGNRDLHSNLVGLLTGASYELVLQYEKETEEQRKRSEQLLSVFERTNRIDGFISYWGEDIEIPNDPKELDPYLRNGSYTLWHTLKDTPIYKLYRRIRELNDESEFENNCHRVCLYIVLSIEHKRLVELYNQQVDDRLFLSRKPQRATGIPEELDTPEFKKILKKAIKKGFVKEDNGSYEWLGTNLELDSFITWANKTLGMEGKNGRRQLKPFCFLFNRTGKQIADAHNDMLWYGSPMKKKEITSLFD